MDDQLPGSAGLVVGPIVAPRLRYCCEHFARGGKFAFPELSHELDEERRLLVLHEQSS
jgi:hypothetical protein